MGRIVDFFGAPPVQDRPTPQISNVRKVKMHDNGPLGGIRPLNREDEEYICQYNPMPIMVL